MQIYSQKDVNKKALKGARITIECFSAEEFDNVVTMLLGENE